MYPRALLDGEELTLRRTGAASALASRYLSAPGASRFAMVGTGQIAPHLIESHVRVRPIREVRIWGRRRERARAVAASLHGPQLRVEAVDDLEAAVRWADIVSCATLSQQPLVRGAWLRAGQHLDLVGAFNPQMCEADDAAVVRAELYVDTRVGALAESGEIVGAIARGVIGPQAVRAELGELASGRFKRSHPAAITLFKSVGTALEDLAAAELAIARMALVEARAAGEIHRECSEPMAALIMLPGDCRQRRVPVQLRGRAQRRARADRSPAIRGQYPRASTRGSDSVHPYARASGRRDR